MRVYCAECVHLTRCPETLFPGGMVLRPSSIWGWWPSWRPTSAATLKSAEAKILTRKQLNQSLDLILDDNSVVITQCSALYRCSKRHVGQVCDSSHPGAHMDPHSDQQIGSQTQTARCDILIIETLHTDVLNFCLPSCLN